MYNIPEDESVAKYIEDFLKFIQLAQQDKNIATAEMTQCDEARQDLLHYTELGDHITRPVHAKINMKLKEISQTRRIAKNKQNELTILCNWVVENDRFIKSMENLLGALRKMETKIDKSCYYPRTKVLNDLPPIEGITDGSMIPREMDEISQAIDNKEAELKKLLTAKKKTKK